MVAVSEKKLWQKRVRVWLLYDYCYDFGWNFGCVLIFSFLVDAKSGSTDDYRIGSSDTSDSNPFSPGSNDIKNSKRFKVFPVSRKTGLKILTFSLISIEKVIEYLSLSENLKELNFSRTQTI